MRSTILLAASGLLLAAGPAEEKPTMTDEQKIQGAWSLVSGERHGKPFPEDVVKNVTLVFAKDILTTKNRDRETTAKFTLHEHETPKQIDLDMDGSIGEGIYELTGDDLKLLHGEVGDPRPAAFDANRDHLTLLILKRKPD